MDPLNPNQNPIQNQNINPNQSKIEKVIAFVQANKLIALAGVVLVTIVILIIGITSTNNRVPQAIQTENTQQQQQQQQQQQTPTIAVQQPFKVLETIPLNNETEIYPGEITLSIKTNTDILSQDEFSLTFSPALTNYYRPVNSYPTKTIEAQIYGGLQKNTKYTVTLLNKNQNPVYSWSFTTSNEQQDSSSQLTKDLEEQKINRDYPLFEFIPYESANFNLDYTKELTLEVIIKNPDTETVKKEVEAWIRSQNVDPSTHTIIYKNNF